MHGAIEDWKNGWFGVSIGMEKEEIEALIGSLQALINDPDQHFHIDNESKEQKEGLGQITFYTKDIEEPDNMWLGGFAYKPGEIIQKEEEY